MTEDEFNRYLDDEDGDSEDGNVNSTDSAGCETTYNEDIEPRLLISDFDQLFGCVHDMTDASPLQLLLQHVVQQTNLY